VHGRDQVEGGLWVWDRNHLPISIALLHTQQLFAWHGSHCSVYSHLGRLHRKPQAPGIPNIHDARKHKKDHDNGGVWSTEAQWVLLGRSSDITTVLVSEDRMQEISHAAHNDLERAAHPWQQPCEFRQLSFIIPNRGCSYCSMTPLARQDGG
jgi:hypothetical protein